MGNAHKIRFAPCAWSNEVAATLAAISDATPADFANWQQHIAAGSMRLIAVTVAGDVRGVVVWSIENEPSRRAVIINAASIAPIKGVCMASIVTGYATAMAAQHDAQVIRFWTTRKGLVRKMRHEMTTHYVMEKIL